MLPMLPFFAGLIAGAAAVSTLRSSSRPGGAADACGAPPPAATATPAPAPQAAEAPAGARRVRRQHKGRAAKGAGA